MDIKIPNSLIEIASLTDFDIFIVGGFMRNSLANLDDSCIDIDIAGSRLASSFNLPKGYSCSIVNDRLGTAVIKCPNGDLYEYTPFRVESYGVGGDHIPEKIAFTADIAKDAMRRDFCCNAIYLNVKTKEIVDIFDGKKDCKDRVLRSHEPDRIFADDGLRLMRLVRIAAETGFEIEKETAKAAKKNARLLKDISKERVRIELDKILQADIKYNIKDAHYRGLKLLKEFRFLEYIIPELLQGDKMPQNKKYHKFDVLEHIFQTVRFAHSDVRLAALLHDIGKPYCQKNFDSMHGHEMVGEKMSRRILGQSGLKYPNAISSEVARLCLHHMYDINGDTKENKMRLFVAKNHDIIEKLFLLFEADNLGSGVKKPSKANRVAVVYKKMLDEKAPLKLADLKINGTDLLVLGIKGNNIGAILNGAFEKCVVDSKLNNKEWLLAYASKLKNEN